MMTNTTERLIEVAKTKLIETYNPLEIYLFGSYAWGAPTEDSDLDILVIVNELVKDRNRLLFEGYLALFNLGIAKDLLLYTKEEFEEQATNMFSVCFKVKRDGKQTYTKAYVIASPL